VKRNGEIIQMLAALLGLLTLSDLILSRMTSALRTSPLVLSSASTVALAFDPLVELTALIT